MARPLERFCKRGHDTWEVGRVPKNGWCRTCARAAQSAGGRHPDAKKGNYTRRGPSIAWERKRIKRWYEIEAADPIPTHHGTVGRFQEFEVRLQRLEADVPTPEKA